MKQLIKLALAVYCVILFLNVVAAQGRKLKEAPDGRFEGENEDGSEVKIKEAPADRFKIAPADRSEVKISELEFSEEKTRDWASKGVEQIKEKVQFQIPSTSENSEVSLFYFDSEEAVWVEESAQKEEKSVCVRRGQCQTTVTLSKPLVGYDLLKSAGCGEEKFKKQPFKEGRWGVVKEEKEERKQCSMVIVKTGKISVAQIYPDAGCPQRELQMFPIENPDLTVPNGARIVGNTLITNFNKMKIGNMRRKFVCMIIYTHYGYSTSLDPNGNHSADMKVFYRPNNGVGWGHLLDLGWVNFNSNNGKNIYRSVVTAQHLHSQGVQWKKCFKCQANVNGIVVKKCVGSCTCN